MKITQNITLDIENLMSFRCVINAKQNDNGTREICAALTEGGQKYAIPSGAAAKIRCAKPDGHFCQNDAVVDVQAGTVTFTLTEQMLACPGQVTADIALSSGEKLLSTATFTILVDRIPGGDELASSNEFLELEHAVRDSKAAMEEAIAAAAKAEEQAKIATQSSSGLISRVEGLESSGVLDVRNAPSKNGIDDGIFKGKVFGAEFVAEYNRKVKLPINPRFKIAGHRVVTTLWFTDGTQLIDQASRGCAAIYLDASGNQLAVKQFGNPSSTANELDKAVSIMFQFMLLEEGGQAQKDCIGKTIRGVCFTLLEDGENYQPYGQSMESARLEKIDNEIETLRGKDVLDVGPIIGKNGIDDSAWKGLIFNEEFCNTHSGDSFQINPAFEFGTDAMSTNIWFTDGTRLFGEAAMAAHGFAVRYYAPDGREITWTQIGGVTKPQYRPVGATSLKIFMSVLSDETRKFFGKKIAGVTFTKAQDSQEYTPYSDVIGSKNIAKVYTTLGIQTRCGVNGIADTPGWTGKTFDENFIKTHNWDKFKVGPNFHTAYKHVIVDIWFTDGTKMAPCAENAQALYRTETDAAITWNTLGAVSGDRYPLTEDAKFVKIGLPNKKPEESAKYYGKIIEGVSFTLEGQNDKFHPYQETVVSQAVEENAHEVSRLAQKIDELSAGGSADYNADFVHRYTDELFKSGESTYQALLFSDPHCWGVRKPVLKEDCLRAMLEISGVDKNCCFENVLCGGDWIDWGEGLTRELGLEELALTYGFTAAHFKQYHTAVGNHDYAFYYSQPILSDAQVRNGLIPDEPELYYTFQSSHHKVIVLNTGMETSDSRMSEAQLQFLRDELLSADRNIVILCHIAFTGTGVEDQWGPSGIFLPARAILDDYNRRAAPFQAAKYKVLTVLSGHIHDYHMENSETGIVIVGVDRLVSVRDAGIFKYYGIIVDDDNRRLTVVQPYGETLTYSLPQP